MASITRFHPLHPAALLNPSATSFKFHRSFPFFSIHTRRNSYLRRSCDGEVNTRKLHATPQVRCNSKNGGSSTESSQSVVGDLLDFLNESWTQFHATAEAKRQLLAAGFHLLNENEEWKLKPGGRYFFTRNMSSLVAFAIGEKYLVGNGFHVIAAHTDSPCLKLKPNSASSKSGYLMVNVQTYGGGLWHTWFDRDLSLAGRVILRNDDGSFSHELVKINRPILRVPTLAIHLNRTVNTDGFKPNLETQLIPLLATEADKEYSKPDEKTSSSSSKDTSHHPLLMQILADELGCKVQDIASIELNVCDTQPSCLGGANDEFIFSGRLDNLASSFCALRALIDACASPEDLENEHAIRMVALFDNEEVGSDSYQGAGAPTMFEAMRTICASLGQHSVTEGGFARAFRHSFLVSADMAHGVHPNFIDKHEEYHRPMLQKGLVIKHNANQRYATSGVTSFLFNEVASIHNLPTQEFVVRNDMGCGSTIGPILASGVGIRTVDCGIAQLSMHSVREICGKHDVDIAYKHFKAFYKTFSSIDKRLNVDF
ncbi:probable aspartyl aminopeptidase [Andrographis paniculata]|uniref:probable aspartyl aminopeptidase n=1 Tax=Andrographis paniculata TaxID=175694 RepID=UPI0021E82401|nr:probable aspartyl aminopeptidase [Andrographis paniculata]XP_051142777.1 probable aspartyl aminopeptidase [Andrographis paniculata]